jgi:acyl dehydratase
MEPIAVSKSITLQKMAHYTGAGSSGIHSDENVAQQQGLGGALAQGGQLVGYLNETMFRTLGPGYISGGEISVTFIHPVRPGDTVTTRGVQKESTTEDGRTRIAFEVWLENQNGDKCTVGTASGYAP